MVYREVLLGDYFKFEKGLGYKGEFLAEESDVALIGMDSHEEGGGYKEGSEKFYTGPFKPEHIAEVGDVIFAGTEQGFGLLASPLIVPESDKFTTYLFSGDVLKAVPLKPEEFSVEYLYNLYRVEKFRIKTAYGDTGTTVRRISNDNFAEQIIPLPDLATQQAINELISMIDQQIANNKALSKSLEVLAQAMFKSWFVDFDPVHTKIRGEKPFGMDNETAGLFPNSFEDSELGMIPKGWSLKAVGSLCDTLLGGTPSRKKDEYWGGDIAWINSGKINEFRITSASEFITIQGLEKSATKLLPKGTTVLAITGATLGQYSRLEIDCCANQSVIGILESVEASNEFIYLSISNGIQRLISAQTGGAQQHINKEDVNSFLILYPGSKLLTMFTNLVKPLFEEIGLLVIQSMKLAETRNALLPRLISGEIIISDEKLVS